VRPPRFCHRRFWLSIFVYLCLAAIVLIIVVEVLW
jgi:hypothetical protein